MGQVSINRTAYPCQVLTIYSSTRGLDASTALEFVKALRISTDVFETTTIVSIYQAAESLYQHSDKVCVLYEGRMAYFGPTDRAKQYFLDMGYVIMILKCLEIHSSYTQIRAS